MRALRPARRAPAVRHPAAGRGAGTSRHLLFRARREGADVRAHAAGAVDLDLRAVGDEGTQARTAGGSGLTMGSLDISLDPLSEGLSQHARLITLVSSQDSALPESLVVERFSGHEGVNQLF